MNNIIRNRDDVFFQLPVNIFDIHVDVGIQTVLQPTGAWFRHLEVDVEIEEKSVQNILLEFSDEMFQPKYRNSLAVVMTGREEVRPKYGKFLVDADDCLDKVVVVDAADKVRQEVLSDVIVDTGEEELEQVQHTGTEVCPAKVLEDQVRTEIS